MNPDKCHPHHHPGHQSGPAGYYWRDYTGEIPEDAFPGGHDLNSKPTYIGQAFLEGEGVIPTTLYPGQAGLNLPCNWKVNYSDISMKILCTSNRNSLSWENTTSQELLSTITGRRAVIGGHQRRGKLYVGRVMHQGELLVGKIHSNEPLLGIMYYVGSNKEIDIKSYQVLVQNSCK
ncbi:hypothetical protein Zmor_025437 [Zophobas morio]|uniref:Uncharacterized protein n=1 Tax=Zophobas morio TaxID=2755281 RepID=A0AA38HS25_9CUCU|nr:hypothetical protein Zmor_025437 [Zophobas morio]